MSWFWNTILHTDIHNYLQKEWLGACTDVQLIDTFRAQPEKKT